MPRFTFNLVEKHLKILKDGSQHNKFFKKIFYNFVVNKVDTLECPSGDT